MTNSNTQSEVVPPPPKMKKTQIRNASGVLLTESYRPVRQFTLEPKFNKKKSKKKEGGKAKIGMQGDMRLASLDKDNFMS